MKIKVIGFNGSYGVYPYEYKSGYEFVKEGEDYDWLVVYDELPEPVTLKCPSANTIFATWEPISIKYYTRDFTRQFAHLLTNRPFDAERHPGYHLGRGYYRPFWGRSSADCGTFTLPEKTKLISSACSSKQMKHTQHYARYHLMETLVRSVPGFEWYGHGVRPFNKKYEILDEYKYHVVVENHIAPYHWTEKIMDPILAECLSFYAGDPRLAEDLPPGSFIPIPIDDPEKAAAIINEAIANDEYSKRRAAVLEAKRLILTKYNFWQQVIDVIESGDAAFTPEATKLYPRRMLRWRRPGTLFDAFGWKFRSQSDMNTFTRSQDQ